MLPPSLQDRPDISNHYFIRMLPKQTLFAVLACVNSAVGQTIPLGIIDGIPFLPNDCKSKVLGDACTLSNALGDLQVSGTCELTGLGQPSCKMIMT